MWSYMIIGLTPFLYLHNKSESEKMQDGIFHRKVSVFSCNRENCDFLYSKLLTCILRSAILKLLGQSEKTAFQCVKKTQVIPRERSDRGNPRS